MAFLYVTFVSNIDLQDWENYFTKFSHLIMKILFLNGGRNANRHQSFQILIIISV